MINLELSAKHQETQDQLRQVAEHMMRPYSRKYDTEEHSYPKEMEEVCQTAGRGSLPTQQRRRQGRQRSQKTAPT